MRKGEQKKYRAIVNFATCTCQAARFPTFSLLTNFRDEGWSGVSSLKAISNFLLVFVAAR